MGSMTMNNTGSNRGKSTITEYLIPVSDSKDSSADFVLHCNNLEQSLGDNVLYGFPNQFCCNQKNAFFQMIHIEIA